METFTKFGFVLFFLILFSSFVLADDFVNNNIFNVSIPKIAENNTITGENFEVRNYHIFYLFFVLLILIMFFKLIKSVGGKKV